MLIGRMDQENNNIVRVWMDGCFDLLHYGHANSLRQAKQMGDVLVVGTHNDKEIEENKGVHVMNTQERYTMIDCMRYIDEHVHDAIFCPTLVTLEQNHCQFATHGDDLTVNTSGADVYASVRNTGKLKLFSRTDGISTTDIIDRILYPEEQDRKVPFVNMHLFQLFQQNMKLPKKTDKVVYIAGDFDIFNPSHVQLLQSAAKLGDHVTVGVYSDQTVHRLTSEYPVLSLHERALILMSCKYVSQIIMGAEVEITGEFLMNHKIDLVVCSRERLVRKKDPYAVPKAIGKFCIISGDPNLSTTSDIIQRVRSRRIDFEDRNDLKRSRETCG